MTPALYLHLIYHNHRVISEPRRRQWLRVLISALLRPASRLRTLLILTTCSRLPVDIIPRLPIRGISHLPSLPCRLNSIPLCRDVHLCP
ncbi:hypothetical protein CERSUDRAFT_83663 [Gelatoporia subvermispora B]|uniref:Uncharacterized protein n=1 Tax=Ceriporiopsis subvermispora (strain B) TaxID=914234 RepID=M2QLL1_CERS8|nr:hypothetical protein CERSUDRAFT_83663 [Gelatoporia subvermispora B]